MVRISGDDKTKGRSDDTHPRSFIKVVETQVEDEPSRCGGKVRQSPAGRNDENGTRNNTVRAVNCRQIPDEEETVQAPVYKSTRGRVD